jgi:hypothetical protein
MRPHNGHAVLAQRFTVHPAANTRVALEFARITSHDSSINRFPAISRSFFRVAWGMPGCCSSQFQELFHCQPGFTQDLAQSPGTETLVIGYNDAPVWILAP